MFNYQTTVGDRLRKAMEVLAPVLVDGNLTFHKGGLSIEGITKTVHVRLDLPPTASMSFQDWGTDRISVGLDFKALCGWLKAVVPGDIISFEISKKQLEGDKPILLYRHWNDFMNHEVYMPVLDIEETRTEKKDKPYDTILSLPSVHFDEFLKRHNVGATLIQLSSIVKDSETPKLVVASFGTTPGLTTRACNRASVIGSYESKHVSCVNRDKFEIKTLRSVSRAYSVSDSVNLHLRSNSPLLLTYQLGQSGSLEFRVLPHKPKEAETAPAVPVQEVEKRSSPIKRKRKKAKFPKTGAGLHAPKSLQFPDEKAKPKAKPKKKQKLPVFPSVRASQKCGECGFYVIGEEEIGTNPADPHNLYHQACLKPIE